LSTHSSRGIDRAFDTAGEIMGRLCLCAVLSSFVLTTPVSAQTSYQSTGFRHSHVVDETFLSAGRVEIGFTAAGMWAHTSLDAEGGGTLSQNTLYLAPGLVGGIMVADWFEVRALVELKYIGTSIDGETNQDTLAGAVAAQGLFHYDLGLGLAFYGGIGLGGYYGHRNEPSGTVGVNYGFTTYGGLTQALLGLLVQPGAHLMMRGGLRLDFLFGSESPDNSGLGLSSAFAMNTIVLAELSLGWRF
jgi:hypothetical protein